MSYTSHVPRNEWVLSEAIGFIRQLEHHLGGRYHVGLTGGVLMRGSSAKDIDVLIYPHSLDKCSLNEIRGLLVSFGMTLRIENDIMRAHWRKSGSTDSKHVEIWQYENKGVDIIIPYGE